MRTLILIAALVCSAPGIGAEDNSIKRHELGGWERDIGYSGVVEINDKLYISGVTCSGKDMEEAVKACYTTVHGILKKFNLGTNHIIKETLFTTDIEALKKAIPARKTFFNSGKYPAATWVQVSRLYDPAHLLEVELIVQRK